MPEKTSTFAARLKELLILRDMTQSELSVESGISRSSINHYLRGHWEAKQDAVYELAKAGHVNPAWLMGYVDDPTDYEDPALIASIPLSYMKACGGDVERAFKMMREVDEDAAREAASKTEDIPGALPVNPVHRIPLLGQIAAGLPIYAEENLEGYIWTDRNHGGEYFSLRVRGDSMNAANINDGDIVIVRRQEEVEEGEIAVVLVDEEATIKRYSQDGKMVVLSPQSTNPEHHAQIYSLKDHQIKILGRVVESRTEY